jgi:cell division protein FtsA
MNQNPDNLIVVLDIGSAWTRVLAADLNEGALRYCGYGAVESAGMRKGLISDLGPAAKAVKAANEEAERVAHINIDECVVGVGGPHIRGLNTNGGIELGGRMREIDKEDVRSAVERARSVERPPDREILHLLPRQFILDDQPGIFDPVGMVGKKLEVDLHIATCSGSALQSTVTCANRAGLEVTEAVLESIASAEATLTADERELGVCLLDIGCHSSDLVVFFEGAVAYTASVPIGGQHFTNDLAVGLQVPVAQAEELKLQYGNAVVTAVPESAEIEIANPRPRRLRQRTIAEKIGRASCRERVSCDV